MRFRGLDCSLCWVCSVVAWGVVLYRESGGEAVMYAVACLIVHAVLRGFVTVLLEVFEGFFETML